MVVPVPDQLEYISDADGVTKDFPYPTRFLQKDEIVVVLRDADGIDTPQYLNQHFTIAGSSWPNGGVVSFYNAPAAGLKVVRTRMTQAKQSVDLENKQRNDATAVELQLDRLTMAIQDRDIRISALRNDLLRERLERIAADLLERAQRIAADVLERTERIAGDRLLQSQIDEIALELNQFDALIARAEAAANSSEAAAQTAQDLVEAATSGYIGFQDNLGYDFGYIADDTTYFDQDWGSIAS
ncbi:MAG: tailspike protein [Caudoviricetes sp.]|nr:MAG: tailspike protein [Caudoviricetes sp.]